MDLVVVLVLGLIIGSFLNVCIHRIPRRLSLVRPGSACPSCGHSVRPYDNVPLVSYLVLRGRCRDCGARISTRYPLIELATGLSFVAVSTVYADPWSRAVGFAFAALMVVVAFVDYDHRIIPNRVVLFGAGLGLLGAPVAPPGLAGALVGALVGGGTLLAVAFLYRATTGVEGMGAGDVKLMAMVGLFVGWQGALFTIFIGALVGSVFGLGLIVFKGQGRRAAVPFGTFLAPAAVVVWLAGDEALRWYTSILSGP